MPTTGSLSFQQGRILLYDNPINCSKKVAEKFVSYTEEEEISVRDIFEFICTQPNALDGKRDCDLSSLTQKDIAEIDFDERSKLECELVPSCRFL